MCIRDRYLDPYVGLWRHKDFGKRIAHLMEAEFSIPKRETERAVKACLLYTSRCV